MFIFKLWPLKRDEPLLSLFLILSQMFFFFLTHTKFVWFEKLFCFSSFKANFVINQENLCDAWAECVTWQFSKENGGKKLNGIRTDCDGARGFFFLLTKLTEKWSDLPLKSEQKMHNSEHIKTIKCFVFLLLFCLFVFFSSVLVCVYVYSLNNSKRKVKQK